MATMRKITPCLWFDGQGEAAANFYVGIFPNSRVTTVSSMVVAFELDGNTFTALNGGPQFKFNEAVSFQVACADQAEIDHFWNRLSDGGDPSAQQCGWLKDKFGLSWQVIPANMGAFFTGDPEGAKRAADAMMTMKKIEIDGLQRARDGTA